MSDAEILKPGLYGAEGTPAFPNHPSLKGGRCQCGYVFFPLQSYGCEVCGRSGDALQPQALSGCGTLIASATVHIHAAARTPTGRTDVAPHTAPFTIGSIKLDDGPTVRTLLVDVDERALKPGQRMVSRLVSVATGAEPILDLRFTSAF